jgi:hypothetical protein
VPPRFLYRGNLRTSNAGRAFSTLVPQHATVGRAKARLLAEPFGFDGTESVSRQNPRLFEDDPPRVRSCVAGFAEGVRRSPRPLSPGKAVRQIRLDILVPIT